MYLPDENLSTSHEENPNPDRGQEMTLCSGSIKLKRSVPVFARMAIMAAALGFAVLFLCQCRRQSSTATPTPTPIPAAKPMATPTPAATAAATVTSTPNAPPAATLTPANTPPPPVPALNATPESFEDGIKHVLQAAGSGFRELRGTLVNEETGSGSYPLFRSRKIYAGTFVFGGASSAELEEVYYRDERQPAYNYRLNYQALSSKDSIDRYVDLRQRLNQLLQGFQHTYGDRYDAWARADPVKTAVLLNMQELPGSLQIQVHAAFSSPQW